MRKLHRHLALIAFLASFAHYAPAAAAANIANGKALAQQWCTNCHKIDRNMPNAIESQPVGPDFMTMKTMTSVKLRAQLKNPHPVMSNFPDLSDRQISDLAGYISSVSK